MLTNEEFINHINNKLLGKNNIHTLIYNYLYQINNNFDEKAKLKKYIYDALIIKKHNVYIRNYITKLYPINQRKLDKSNAIYTSFAEQYQKNYLQSVHRAIIIAGTFLNLNIDINNYNHEHKCFYINLLNFNLFHPLDIKCNTYNYIEINRENRDALLATYVVNNITYMLFASLKSIMNFYININMNKKVITNENTE